MTRVALGFATCFIRLVAEDCALQVFHWKFALQRHKLHRGRTDPAWNIVKIGQGIMTSNQGCLDFLTSFPSSLLLFVCTFVCFGLRYRFFSLNSHWLAKKRHFCKGISGGCWMALMVFDIRMLPETFHSARYTVPFSWTVNQRWMESFS